MSTGAKLTEEQRQRIEENRRKALEKRAARMNQDASRTVSAKVVTVASTQSFSRPLKEAQKVPQQSSTSSASTGNSQAVNYHSNSNITHPRTVSNASQLPPTSTISNAVGKAETDSVRDFVSRFAYSGPSSNPKNKNTFIGADKFFSSNVNRNVEKIQPKNSLVKSTTTDHPCSDSQSLGFMSEKSSKGLSKVVKGCCVLLSRKRFAVNVGFHGPLIAIFKTMPSRSYDQATLTWSFDLGDYNKFMSAIKVLQPAVQIKAISKSVLSVVTAATPGTLKDLSTQDINLNSVDSKLVSALMPFQKQGVSFSIRHDGRVLIADDMGLGKTVQAICVACYYRKEWPLLVIVPSSVRLTWQQAFIRWLPSVNPQDVNVVLSGKDKPTSGLVNIISYDLLSKCTEQLMSKQLRVIIADESHFIKSYKAARTKAALPLMKRATRVILLSGTPALSRPMELYTQISAVKPNLFPSFHEFGVRYCGAKENRWGWDYSGSSNMEELQLILQETIMIRRLKTEVLNELPSKRRQMVLLDPSLIKTKPLERAAKQVANAKKDQHGALLNYFYESCSSKMAAVKEYVLDLLEGGHKFLVFAHHKDMLDAISQCITAKKYKSIRIDGNTPSTKRQSLCDQFQNEKDVRVAVLSITAANTGLTLTEGTAVVFAELFWNPGALVQAEDRVYRIGQKNSVNVHYLVAKATADDFLWPLIQGKLDVLSKAGLSGDDFSDADMATFKDPKQKTLFSCFETLFEENDDLNSSLPLEHETSSSPTSAVTMATDTKTSFQDGGSKDEDFDWFVSMDDDKLLEDCENSVCFKDSTSQKDVKIRKISDTDTQPLVKRCKRQKR